MTREEKVKAIATTLVNQKVMRNGSPPIKNVLDLLPKSLKEEVLSDAEVVLKTIEMEG